MSIWKTDEIQSYNIGKAETSFSKWRLLIMLRISEITGLDNSDSANRIQNYGLRDLGLDYDRNVTADELARKLAA